MGNHVVELNRWFETPLGKRLLREEACILQQVLPQLFGYHLLQIGSVGHGDLLESSRIMHRCVLSRFAHTICNPYSSIYGDAEALPFAQDSLDVVVLPHILEFEENPHEILREVERVLIPEGYIVILGFNPFSLWGGWRFLVARHKTVPWCGRFLPLLRIKDWLALLGFDLKKQQTFFFALPFHNDRFKNYTKYIEKIGSRWMGNFGAVSIVIAKKRIATLTPIKTNWLPQTASLVGDAVGTHFKKNK
ncbi:methyltransferase domain-containing protein [Candidatus Parabeggiatoa sp. HSG14]|uniref:class I SAM-dependent methyltransferase n=1 Tax=Candidatus Parabeggiatoa sp. HSG14 TaxID=3055593 RepID=UPI0025A6E2DF|nr:methyltransferase domain-containing protein [Thiotrichales bacterium HSG14]